MLGRSGLGLIVLGVLLVCLTLAVADLLLLVLGVLLIIFGGILFGVFLSGLTHWLSQRTWLNYLAAYIVVVLTLVVAVVGGGVFMGAQVAQQVVVLWSELQDLSLELFQRLQENDFARENLPDLQDVRNSLGGEGAASHWLRGVQHLGSTVGQIGLVFSGGIVIFVLGAYLAFALAMYTAGIVKMVPLDRRDRAREVLSKLYIILNRWIVGRLISMAIIGVCTTIGLWLMGVPLPFTLGVLAALLTFIPNLGPVMAAIPQALLALKVGPMLAVYVILFNIVLQAIESYLIDPLIQLHEVTLPPALTVSVQLLMATLLGIVGALFAAPLAAALMVLVQMLYIQDYLGDPRPGRMLRRAET